jgi:hypothetical protein
MIGHRVSSSSLGLAAIVNAHILNVKPFIPHFATAAVSVNIRLALTTDD